jgi:hypothetical protein
MPNLYEIPLSGSPQRFSITLPVEGAAANAVAVYTMTFNYRAADPAVAGGCGWTLDISDQFGNPVLCGMPLVTGTDLLGQFAYLDLGGHLGVRSEGIPDATPTFDNLGSGSHLYWVTLP